jgi:hypothetical protein
VRKRGTPGRSVKEGTNTKQNQYDDLSSASYRQRSNRTKNRTRTRKTRQSEG